jgi:hypothetical protein
MPSMPVSHGAVEVYSEALAKPILN